MAQLDQPRSDGGGEASRSSAPRSRAEVVRSESASTSASGGELRADGRAARPIAHEFTRRSVET